MTKIETEHVWNGAPALASLLAPISDLRTHPRNARRGDVRVIAQSLSRFGQQRPVLALSDGVIVAGNHTYRAAVELIWSHIAVVRSDLTGDEVEAYLVADNRTADLGTHADEALAALLRRASTPTRFGTGYCATTWSSSSQRSPGATASNQARHLRPLDEARTCPHCGGVL